MRIIPSIRHLLCATAMVAAAIAPGAEGGGGHSRSESKRAILLVAFGTSVGEARKAYDHIERLARDRFPGQELRWAYTSSMVRRKLAKAGTPVDGPLTALARLHEDGFSQVTVQSLHIVAGAEFHDLAEEVALFRGRIPRLGLGLPLLATYEDLDRAARATLAAVPAERRPEDAILLMGHGNEKHPSDLAYLAADAQFRRLDPKALLGTVEGRPNADEVIASIRSSGAKRVFLLPFMTVAGDHARNDLAGPEAGSWASRLKAAGLEVVPVLKGLGEYDPIVAIWLDHCAQVQSQSE